MKNKTLIALSILSVVLIIFLLNFVNQAYTKELSVADHKISLTAPKQWDIKNGDGKDTFGANYGENSIGIQIKDIESMEIEEEIDSWITLYSVSSKYNLGIYELTNEYEYITSVNGIRLFRKKLEFITENELTSRQIAVFGEFETGKLARIFIDQSNIRWMIIYSLPKEGDLNHLKDSVKVMDEILRSMKIN